MWVTSSSAQQNVLVSQNCGEECQDVASQEAADVNILAVSPQLASGPRA